MISDIRLTKSIFNKSRSYFNNLAAMLLVLIPIPIVALPCTAGELLVKNSNYFGGYIHNPDLFTFFDSNGTVASITSTFPSNPEASSLEGVADMVYDSNGQLFVLTTDTQDNGFIYTYDETLDQFTLFSQSAFTAEAQQGASMIFTPSGGLLVKNSNYFGGYIHNPDLFTFFDSNGTVASITSTFPSNPEASSLEGVADMVYDSNGQLFVLTTDTQDNGFIYTYDETLDQFTLFSQSAFTAEAQQGASMIFTPSGGLLVKNSNYFGGYIHNPDLFTFFDSNGTVASITSTFPSNPEASSLEGVADMVYDSNGQLFVLTTDTQDNGFIYTYDETLDQFTLFSQSAFTAEAQQGASMIFRIPEPSCFLLAALGYWGMSIRRRW